MSFQNRINAIQMRMRQIQSKFGSSPIQQFSPTVTNGVRQVGLNQGPAGTGGITFEKLLATKMKESETSYSSSTASSGHVKGGNISSKAADYDPIVKEASQKYGVDEKFIKAIIQQESGFNPNATSAVGAMGMMQLMPGTAKDLGVRNAYDARDNIMGGVKYIKQQLDRFGGDKRKALAAYNAGPGAVMKFGGIPPYRETQNYVKSIMGNYVAMGGS